MKPGDLMLSLWAASLSLIWPPVALGVPALQADRVWKEVNVGVSGPLSVGVLTWALSLGTP